ncbi:M14 family zinc carboxypeptidase [Ferrimonas pelagia]|uniref:M14 family metallopeptidase n=1 Tax=Ferrimonas pelagia TaxID=1177826 RepID=A0ABP9F0V3_9GAMM
MKTRLKWLLLLVFLPLYAGAALLPAGSYLPQVPAPEEYFAEPVGQRHLRSDEVAHYLEQLARQSERVAVQSLGQSYQGRAQQAVLISSPANLAKQEAILQQRAAVRQGQTDEGPLIIWLAYSIHGDEASGLHAGVLFAYYLAASQSAEVARWLDEAVIVITPTQNPDGNDRFANWVNGYRGQIASGSSWHREHYQAWPSGRVNHFWADLNRDWLYQAHPESRARVAFFQQWLPHVVSDYHEMSHQSSYFFQPGVPERTHPLTPEDNQALTARLASYHAQALDQLYQPYFSKEAFDDFYYGKGSTYPDINGSVGILFEQASARGLVRATDRGELTLHTGIRNHLATSFSTVRGAIAEAEALREYQQGFYVDSVKAGKKRSGAGYLLGTAGDANRLAALVQILASHRIEFDYLSQSVTEQGIRFLAGELFVPFAQPQYRLLEALLDQRTEFRDNTFYDVSAFSVALAFNLNVRVAGRQPGLRATAIQSAATDLSRPALHWHLSWQDRLAPAALYRLQQAGLRVRFADTAAVLAGQEGPVDVAAGDLLILGDQSGLEAALTSIQQELGLRPNAVVAGQALSGPDPGGRHYHFAKPIKPLILIGRDVSQTEAGMLWYYLDQVLALEATLIDAEYAERVPLDEFTHLFLVDGGYRRISDGFAYKVGQFVGNGGTVVAWKRGVAKLSSWELIRTRVRQKSQLQEEFVHASDWLHFAQRHNERARRTIGGAIVAWQLDQTHPLGFGLSHYLPMMKDRELSLQGEQADQVAIYPEALLLSGFMDPTYQQALARDSAATVERNGRGQYVLLADNPLFRNFWLGGERVVANSLFLVPSLR